MTATIATEWVTLTWYEAEQAIFVGARREAEAIRHNIVKPQYSGETSVSNHIESAGAERAAAKLLNLDWHASINTFKDGAPDVGATIEVRYRRADDYDLIVRANDHDDRRFMLVRGQMPTYEIVGWIWGRDAKRPEFLANHGGHGEAWFVPEAHLRPISDLMSKRPGGKP